MNYGGLFGQNLLMTQLLVSIDGVLVGCSSEVRHVVIYSSSDHPSSNVCARGPVSILELSSTSVSLAGACPSNAVDHYNMKRHCTHF